MLRGGLWSDGVGRKRRDRSPGFEATVAPELAASCSWAPADSPALQARQRQRPRACLSLSPREGGGDAAFPPGRAGRASSRPRPRCFSLGRGAPLLGNQRAMRVFQVSLCRASPAGAVRCPSAVGIEPSLPSACSRLPSPPLETAPSCKSWTCCPTTALTGCPTSPCPTHPLTRPRPARRRAPP